MDGYVVYDFVQKWVLTHLLSVRLLFPSRGDERRPRTKLIGKLLAAYSVTGFG